MLTGITTHTQHYLSSVQDVQDLGNDGVHLGVVFLTHHLDVSQLAKVEVSLLLQSIHSEFQIQ